MTTNPASGGLRRETWNHPYGAQAHCEDCDFLASGAAPETIAAKARDHARSENHITVVQNERITEYTPYGREADSAPPAAGG